MRYMTLYVAILTVIATSIEANAAIVLIDPPPSVVPGALESDVDIQGFREAGDVLLPETLDVDFVPNGLDTTISSIPSGSFQIDGGIAVDSWFFHYDPVGVRNAIRNGTGSVTFSQDILGMVFRQSWLDSTDGLLGNSGTAYPSGDRALEFTGTPSSDVLHISADNQTVDFSLFANLGIDQLRIIVPHGTVVIPEPTALAIWSVLGVAGIGAGWWRRRRKA